MCYNHRNINMWFARFWNIFKSIFFGKLTGHFYVYKNVFVVKHSRYIEDILTKPLPTSSKIKNMCIYILSLTKIINVEI